MIRSGNAIVTRVEEVYGPGFRASALFGDFDPSVLDEHPDLVSDWGYDRASTRPMAGVQTWILRQGGKTVLVDTGAGNGKDRRPEFPGFSDLATPFLDRLAAQGVTPGDVDVVFCTHIHVDHVGWNTHLVDGVWKPTFPNARYVFGRAEFEHWSPGGAGLAFQPLGHRVMADSVMPVVEAGMAEFVDDGEEILPGMRVELAPGHTAAQLALHVETGDRPLLFAADAFHQPVQIYRPDWSTRFCEDAAASARTRHRLLARCAETGAILVPAHFGDPYACTVVREGGGYALQPPG